MKTLLAIALVSVAACAHSGPVDQNHDAPRAVDRVRDVTNNSGGPLINNSDVQRAKNSTNTNSPPNARR